MTRKFFAELDLVDNNKIINVGDPDDPQDVATKNYVDGMAYALDDMSDVVILSPEVDEVLTYDGVDWVNASPILFDPLSLTVRSAAGVPSGAPTGTELPIAADTTAVTGGLYFWTGAAWTKIATIP